MGMNAVFNYLSQFGTGRLSGVVDVDMGPCLFAEEGWPHAAFGTMTPRASLEAQRTVILNRDAMVSSLIPAMFAAGTVPPPDDLEWWADQSRAVPDLAALALWVSFYAQDWRGLLPSIDVPVLLAHGVKSQVFPTPVWESLAAAIPQTSLSLFEQSGHAPFWEEPERFNTEVMKFASSV
jgi:pimeloyl-ACP methyl ester carboxylesterase